MTTAPLPPPLPERLPSGRPLTFRATFRPDLTRWSPEIIRHDGAQGWWRPLWRISAGMFAGEWACVLIGGGGPAWAPESELIR